MFQKKNIIISNLSSGSINYTLGLKNEEITEYHFSKIKQDKNILEIKINCLLNGCKISNEMFDERGNRDSGWGIGQKRGPSKYLIDYDPPLNRIGYGLNVLDKYDGGDNSWLDYHNQEGECYIAYHGTNGRFVNNILNEGLKKGGRQQCKNSNNINPLSQQEFRKCGEGVYLFQK